MDLRHLTAPFRSKRKGFRSNPEEDFIQRGKNFTQRGKEFGLKRKGVSLKEKKFNLQNEIMQQRGVGADGIGYL